MIVRLRGCCDVKRDIQAGRCVGMCVGLQRGRGGKTNFVVENVCDGRMSRGLREKNPRPRAGEPRRMSSMPRAFGSQRAYVAILAKGKGPL